MPDLVVMAKGLGAGYAPLGAVLAPATMVDELAGLTGFNVAHTFNANPICCAAGVAVIDEVVDRDLMGNAERMGELPPRRPRGPEGALAADRRRPRPRAAERASSSSPTATRMATLRTRASTRATASASTPRGTGSCSTPGARTAAGSATGR